MNTTETMPNKAITIRPSLDITITLPELTFNSKEELATYLLNERDKSETTALQHICFLPDEIKHSIESLGVEVDLFAREGYETALLINGVGYNFVDDLTHPLCSDFDKEEAMKTAEKIAEIFNEA